jgi:hypothetical protein
MVNRTKEVMKKKQEIQPTYSRRLMKTDVSEAEFYEARKTYDHLK